MEVTVIKLGTASNGSWILLNSIKDTTFGKTRVSAFVGVEDISKFSEAQVIMLPKSEYNMIQWSL